MKTLEKYMEQSYISPLQRGNSFRNHCIGLVLQGGKINSRIIQQLSPSWNIVVSYPVDSSIEREKKTVQRCAYKSVLINDQDYL